MVKKDVAKWQRRIEDTFCGPTGVVGESIFKLEEREQTLFNFLVNTFCGYVRLMDAFLGFYTETLELIKERQERKWPDKVPVITAIHIPTFWRFRASYIIFWRGYFIDAVGLLRGVLENALTIIALNKDVVTVENAFADISNEKIKNGKVDWREIKTGVKKTENKIRDALLGNKSSLTTETKEEFRKTFSTMHNSVHRSKINILRYYVPWAKGEKPFPLMPVYDEDLATLYTNLSTFFAWMLVKTFPFLEIQKNEFPEVWRKKYKILDESFEESIRNFPKKSGRSVEEFIAKTFATRDDA